MKKAKVNRPGMFALLVIVLASLYYAIPVERKSAPEKEYTLALRLPPQSKVDALEEEATKGNAEAQFELANNLFFWNGSQVRVSSLYRAAAMQGHPGAEFMMGSILTGEQRFWAANPDELDKWAASPDDKANWLLDRVPPDDVVKLFNPKQPDSVRLRFVTKPDEGVRWLELAAGHGSIEAKSTLVRLYKDGQVVARNIGRSAFWAHDLAEAGDPLSILDYAAFLENGEGVPRDLVQALAWTYLVIASPYSPESGVGVTARRLSQRIEAKLTPNEIAAAKEQVKAVGGRTSVCVGGLQNCRPGHAQSIRAG